jgi:hypothetical protein
MALHRATFEVTCDADGKGSDDVTLKLPSSLSRHALLTTVTVDTSDALRAGPNVTITSLRDVSEETWNGTTEDYELAEQVYFVDLRLDTSTYPSDDGVYEFAAGAAAGRTTIRRKHLRCEVHNGGPSDVYTVNVYYETAGDYRF